MENLGAHVAAHEATLTHMHECLDRIEARLLGIEHRLLYVGGVLGLLMTLYKFL